MTMPELQMFDSVVARGMSGPCPLGGVRSSRSRTVTAGTGDPSLLQCGFVGKESNSVFRLLETPVQGRPVVGRKDRVSHAATKIGQRRNRIARLEIQLDLVTARHGPNIVHAVRAAESSAGVVGEKADPGDAVALTTRID